MTILRGKLQHDYSLAEYTSWQVGGKARLFFQPEDLADLISFFKTLPNNERKIIWLGLGSKVLVRDTGIDGVVIHTKLLNSLQIISDNNIRAEAGLPTAKLVKYYPFLAGIPGTVGGALAMNAGAFGDEIWNYVSKVETINRHGNILTRGSEDFIVSYRKVVLPEDEWFVACEFTVVNKNSKVVEELVQQYTLRRKNTQPIGELTCGSVFCNPEGDYAARLIESCGLKGVGIGGAEVSTKHANFIVNKGNAIATDIEQLIIYIQNEVKNKTGIELIPEVRILEA